MALHDELEPRPAERLPGPRTIRPRETGWELATGTLACPACDAPVLPATSGSSPGDPMTCGYCGEAAYVRDFLSLDEPTRPTRVAVRLRLLATR
jgi:hypothetical protein